MNCECGRPVFAKGQCSSCYRRDWRKRNPDYRRAWVKKNPERMRRYCQEQCAAVAPQVQALSGIETLEALTMAFNVDELSLARYILEQRDRSGTRMTFA